MQRFTNRTEDQINGQAARHFVVYMYRQRLIESSISCGKEMRKGLNESEKVTYLLTNG